MNLKVKRSGNGVYAWIAYTIGITIAAIGVCFGLYAGIWYMLVGGVVQVIDAAKMTPVDSVMIAIGIVKVLFFELVVAIPSILSIFIGGLICATGDIK